MDSLSSRPIEIWDYGKMNTDIYSIRFFRDEVHTTNDGAKIFTDIIKKRLHNKNE